MVPNKRVTSTSLKKAFAPLPANLLMREWTPQRAPEFAHARLFHYLAEKMGTTFEVAFFTGQFTDGTNVGRCLVGFKSYPLLTVPSKARIVTSQKEVFCNAVSCLATRLTSCKLLSRVWMKKMMQKGLDEAVIKCAALNMAAPLNKLMQKFADGYPMDFVQNRDDWSSITGMASECVNSCTVSIPHKFKEFLPLDTSVFHQKHVEVGIEEVPSTSAIPSSTVDESVKEGAESLKEVTGNKPNQKIEFPTFGEAQTLIDFRANCHVETFPEELRFYKNKWGDLSVNMRKNLFKSLDEGTLFLDHTSEVKAEGSIPLSYQQTFVYSSTFPLCVTGRMNSAVFLVRRDRAVQGSFGVFQELRLLPVNMLAQFTNRELGPFLLRAAKEAVRIGAECTQQVLSKHPSVVRCSQPIPNSFTCEHKDNGEHKQVMLEIAKRIRKACTKYWHNTPILVPRIIHVSSTMAANKFIPYRIEHETGARLLPFIHKATKTRKEKKQRVGGDGQSTQGTLGEGLSTLSPTVSRTVSSLSHLSCISSPSMISLDSVDMNDQCTVSSIGENKPTLPMEQQNTQQAHTSHQSHPSFPSHPPSESLPMESSSIPRPPHTVPPSIMITVPPDAPSTLISAHQHNISEVSPLGHPGYRIPSGEAGQSGHIEGTGQPPPVEPPRQQFPVGPVSVPIDDPDPLGSPHTRVFIGTLALLTGMKVNSEGAVDPVTGLFHCRIRFSSIPFAIFGGAAWARDEETAELMSCGALLLSLGYSRIVPIELLNKVDKNTDWGKPVAFAVAPILQYTLTVLAMPSLHLLQSLRPFALSTDLSIQMFVDAVTFHLREYSTKHWRSTPIVLPKSLQLPQNKPDPEWVCLVHDENEEEPMESIEPIETDTIDEKEREEMRTPTPTMEVEDWRTRKRKYDAHREVLVEKVNRLKDEIEEKKRRLEEILSRKRGGKEREIEEEGENEEVTAKEGGEEEDDSEETNLDNSFLEHEVQRLLQKQMEDLEREEQAKSVPPSLPATSLPECSSTVSPPSPEDQSILKDTKVEDEGRLTPSDVQLYLTQSRLSVPWSQSGCPLSTTDEQDDDVLIDED